MQIVPTVYPVVRDEVRGGGVQAVATRAVSVTSLRVVRRVSENLVLALDLYSGVVTIPIEDKEIYRLPNGVVVYKHGGLDRTVIVLG